MVEMALVAGAGLERGFNVISLVYGEAIQNQWRMAERPLFDPTLVHKDIPEQSAVLNAGQEILWIRRLPRDVVRHCMAIVTVLT
jgi:hypothetical protein